MTRRRVLLFAVLASLLVVTAVPAQVGASSDTLVVGSQHTTAQDFEDGSYDNMSVLGSGDSATLAANGAPTDHDLSEQLYFGDKDDDTTYNRTGTFQPTYSGNLTELQLENNSFEVGSDYGIQVDFYVNGKLVKENWTWTSDSPQTVEIDPVWVEAGETVSVRAKTTNTDNDGEYDYANADVDATVENQNLSANYTSQIHDVSNAEQAAINITQASNVSIDAEVRTDGGTVLGSDTITSTGNHTLALSSTSSSQLETVLDITVTGENPQFELADESILFNNDAPSVDNSTASPTGDITQQDIQLSADVSDPQFGSAQGEELTATFYVDGSEVGTDTLNSNGTASVNYTASTGGSHSWHVVVNDSYGGSTTSDTFEFRAPSELRIYNESNPSELLDNATITLQFYGNESTDDPITVTKTVTDGTANLSGLPANQPFVVVASADGFHDRRIFLSSLYDQQEIYLLPTSKSIVQPTYILEDFSGYYPSENSVLAVQREINGSYQTVVGDYFGATGEFEATLEEGVRHRLVIMNTETGRSRPLGTTMATDSSEQIVRVLSEDEIELVTGDDRAPIVGPALSTLPAAGTDITITTYANESQSYDIEITYQNESVSDTLAKTTVSGNSEETVGIDLSDRSGGTVWVNITWTTADGNTATKSVDYAVSKVYVGDQSLLDWIMLVPGEFNTNAQAITSFIAVLLTVLLVGVVAQTARPSGQVLGLIGLAGLASFAVIGFLSYDVLFASTVGYFSLIAIREGL
jgi:hypothetical protein